MSASLPPLVRVLWSSNRIRRFWCRLALLTALWLPVGCADVEQAAQPGSDLLATAAAISPQGTPATPVASPLGLPTAVVLQVASARRVFFTRGGDLWQLPPEGSATPIITGRNLLAFAASPDGERVAVVSEADIGVGGQANEEFAVVAADGTPVLRTLIPSVGSARETVRSIAWTADGRAVAMARADGSITLVGDDGTMRLLVPPQPGHAPGALAWSPSGRTLAYLDPTGASAPASLHAVSIEGGADRVLVRGSARGAVLAAAWLPDGGSLAFVLSTTGMVEGSGDIFTIDPDGGAPTLLVSASQFAPVAGVAGLAVSPSGQYLAFTVAVPGPEHAAFQSLRLLDRASGKVVEVPVRRDQTVVDLWWVGNQLVYRTIEDANVVVPGVYSGTEPFILLQFDPSTGEIQQRYRS